MEVSVMLNLFQHLYAHHNVEMLNVEMLKQVQHDGFFNLKLINQKPWKQMNPS